MREYKVVPCSPRVNERVIKVDSPEATRDYFNLIERHDNKETLIVIILNTRLNAIGHHVVSIGTLNEAMAHPREIFRPLILQAGHAFILVHNHPGGDARPSNADIQITKRVKEAADIFQLNFLDHVIVADNFVSDGLATPMYSFREAGII